MRTAHDPTDDDQFTIDLDEKGLKSRALVGGAQTAGAQITKMVLQFGSTLILARLLFPADFGLIAMVYPIVGFIELSGNLGFGQAIIQRKKLDQRDVSFIFWLNLLIMTVMGTVGVLLSPVMGWIYGEARVPPLMMVISLTLPLGALGAIHSALLARLMRFGQINRNDLAASAVGVVGTVTCASLGLSYWSLVAGQVMATLTAVCLAWASMPWRPSRPAISSGAWGFVKFGANLTGANLASFFTTTGDNFIIGVMNGKVALGIYDRSYKLVVQPLGQLLSPIGSVALPLLSRLQTDPDEYRKVYLSLIRAMLLINVPIMLVCISNSHEIVSLLLGEKWNLAAVTFSWISVGGLLSGLYSSLVWLFISQNKVDVMRRYMISAAIINLSSFFIGTFWGIEGVAACAAIGFVLITVPLVAHGATKVGPVSPRDLAMCVAPFAVTGSVAFAIIKAGEGYVPVNDLAQIFFSVSSCLLVFLISCLFLPAERSLLRFAWSKFSAFWTSSHAPLS